MRLGRRLARSDASSICGRLFDIERAINGKSAQDRLALRQEHSAPLVADLEEWMRDSRSKLSKNSDVAEAMDYMLKAWPAFAAFLDDGRICLSNNAAERALRGIALGRNYAKRRIMCRCWRQTSRLREVRRHELNIITGIARSSTGCRKPGIGRARQCLVAVSSEPVLSSRDRLPRTYVSSRCPRVRATGQ